MTYKTKPIAKGHMNLIRIIRAATFFHVTIITFKRSGKK